MTINVTFDIDGVLNCRSARNLEGVSFFRKKGVVLTALKTHYIYPGVIELMRALFARENVRVSFYSSGDKSRGPIFVTELFKHVFPEGRDISDICILSKEDLVKNNGRQRKRYDISCGNYEKDLTKVIRDCDSLDNAVLIEDDTSYTVVGQEKNVLYIQETQSRDYEALKNKIKVSDQDGRIPIKCRCFDDDYIFELYSTKQILLRHVENQFHVHFRDAKTFKECKETIEETHPLYAKLLPHKENSKLDYYNLELANELRQFVAEKGGLSNKVCHKTNRIFYLAGLLFKAFDQPKPISEFLFEHQIKEDKAKFTEALRDDTLYHLGLEKLRQFNPNLQFITPLNYVECITLPLSDEEKIEFQAFLDNEDRGCCIM